MIFGKRKDESTTVVIDSTKTLTDTTARDVTANAPHPTISVVGEDTKLAEELKIELEKLNLAFACEIAGDTVSARRGAETSSFVVALSLSTERLTDLASVISESREQRTDGLPVLIVCVVPQQMTQLGHWLKTQAELEKLNGIRLVIQTTLPATALEISTRLEPVKELNVLRMPISTEVENSGHKYHFCISPQSRRTVDFIRQLAENKVSRIYLLGGPGSGKTSLAYYYWLCRAKVRPPAAAAGNFITVNLTAESTDDKAAMKSLICGHVAGSFPGAQSREGALSFAGAGVCFLDESHGVSGVVMQILMEVLDSNQFLAWGATKKRQLDCAVVFASNRSWETLRKLINFDEHSRLGATVVDVSNLAAREEDLIAVLSSALADAAKRFTTWSAPLGISLAAWETIRDCRWRGNIRTLLRCVESSAIKWAMDPSAGEVIEATHFVDAINQWEPQPDDENAKLYL